MDASKVTVSGPGIKDGLLSNYCSYFIVDTTGAGVGQLTVRIRGPKGEVHGRLFITQQFNKYNVACLDMYRDMFSSVMKW